MDRQLERIKKAYDLTVEQYYRGISPLDSIPEEIKKSLFYRSVAEDKDVLNSGSLDVREYPRPESGKHFLDAGCSANLVNYRLDRWPSTYYGVDISPALVSVMKNFVSREHITIGGLFVSDLSMLPFGDGFFDISAVIGVMEYCSFEYIKQALSELNRVLKVKSSVVLDIPNLHHPYAEDRLSWRNT